MEQLYNRLVKYKNELYYPMHMPGHKRNTQMCFMDNCYGIDITEIDGFDNLHKPEGILKDAEECAARLYHSEQTYYLLNGSTVGILTGIASCTRKGDKIIMARNCHKAVYNAVFINELIPVYVYPQEEEAVEMNCGILSENIEQLLITYPDVKMVVITSPTYEGIVSDIKKIAEIVHKYQIPLLVDEAHGAHFGLSAYFPESSVTNGADIVIHSVHKTLPALTQTALMHVNGERVKKDRIREYLGIYQSSSPSYVLMASIDQCIHMLFKDKEQLFEKFYFRLDQFYQRMKKLQNLKVYDPFFIKDGTSDEKHGIHDFDRSKIVIQTRNSSMTGAELYDILLKRFQIQMEMASGDYVLAMTSICDTQDGFERLEKALEQIDNSVMDSCGKSFQKKWKKVIPERKFTASEVCWEPEECICLEDSDGRISKEYAYLYPPGIPFIVPGEVINKEILCRIKNYKKSGLVINGLKDKELNYISVVKNLL